MPPFARRELFDQATSRLEATIQQHFARPLLRNATPTEARDDHTTSIGMGYRTPNLFSTPRRTPSQPDQGHGFRDAHQVGPNPGVAVKPVQKKIGGRASCSIHMAMSTVALAMGGDPGWAHGLRTVNALTVEVDRIRGSGAMLQLAFSTMSSLYGAMSPTLMAGTPLSLIHTHTSHYLHKILRLSREISGCRARPARRTGILFLTGLVAEWLPKRDYDRIRMEIDACTSISASQRTGNSKRSKHMQAVGRSMRIDVGCPGFGFCPARQFVSG
jgi:hypothetical protein